MALIDLDTPDDADEWRDDIAARVLLVAFAAALIQFGLRLWMGVEPQGVVFAIPTLVVFALAVQLLLFAAVGVDLENHGRTIGYVIAAVLTGVTLLAVWLAHGWPPRLNTDVLAFTRYALELLSAGTNPMGASLAPAFELSGSTEFATERVDGTRVTQWSYPAGALLAYLPQYALVGPGPIGIRATSIVGVGLLAGVVTATLPPQYAVLGPAALLGPRHQWITAAGGLNDMLWVLPLVAGLWLWARTERTYAAVAVGVACGIKQTPWPILPFLAIWVYRTAPTWRAALREAIRLNVAGAVGFLILAGNLVFLAWSPSAWATSVLTPLGVGSAAPLESFGVGLAALSLAGVTPPHWVFSASVAVVTAGLLAAYWRYFEAAKWVAWITPLAIYLVHARSLASYFNWFFVVAVVAVFAAHGRLRGQPEATAV